MIIETIFSSLSESETIFINLKSNLFLMDFVNNFFFPDEFS